MIEDKAIMQLFKGKGSRNMPWKNQDFCSALINNKKRAGMKKAEKEKAVYESVRCFQHPSL